MLGTTRRRQTELLKWECDKRMFRPRLWAKYADFMRTDCRLYDEYERKEHQWRWGDMPPCILDLGSIWPVPPPPGAAQSHARHVEYFPSRTLYIYTTMGIPAHLSGWGQNSL